MIICKYKFDKSIYENLIPEFNSGYTGYTVSDATNGNIVTRTIECNTLPTSMRFGVGIDETSTSRELSLLEIIELDVSNVTGMQRMFYSCTKLTSLNISNFNTSKVTNMREMFYNCYSLTSLDVSNWDTSNVTNMQGIFSCCYNLTYLDLSNWDTSKVTNMAYMFDNCAKLQSINLSNFDTSNVTDMFGMFNNCNLLTEISNVSNWNTSNVTNMQRLFRNCNNLTYLDLSNWDTSKVTNMGSMFEGCSSLTQLDVSNWDTSNVINMSYMFYGVRGFDILNIEIFNTSNVTNISQMFNYCDFKQIVFGDDFDTSKVTDMNNMFRNCNSLTLLDVSNFNTSNVTNMGYMFCGCNNLTSLDLSNWNTSKVTNMEYIFDNCNNLTSLDVSNFNTSNVTDMGYMFSGCSSLTDIGMIYCDSLTVNKLAELLNTQVRNVYVECDISCYDKYQYITYIQYKEDKKVLLYYDTEDETWKKPVLRQWDSIEKHNDGKYYYHKRSGEVVLNGSEDINIQSMSQNSNINTLRFRVKLDSKTMIADCLNVINDCFSKVVVSDEQYVTDEESINISYNIIDFDQVNIRVLKSKLSTQDVEGFKQWLQTNPTTVVYQLAEEEVYECTNIDLITCQDKTNYSVNTGLISPKSTLKVHINITNIITTLQEKVHTLESELNLLRIDKVLLDIQDIINE